MVRTLLVRGLLVGLLAGLAAGGFAFFFGEPHVEAAIALEEAAAADEAAHAHGTHDAAGAHGHGEEALVSRGGQKAGLFLATGLFGLSTGGIFALVYAALRGRVGPRGDGALALAAAGAAVVAIVLVPFVKYPANPPAVGDPETISVRTVLYLLMVVVGLAAAGVAVATARTVTAGPWERWIAAGVAFLVPVVAAWLLLPAVNEVPKDFPATLLWEFRVSSLGTQVVFWTVFGVLFGLLSDRAAGRRAAAAPTGTMLG
ncbi:MAG: hypothetical protein GEV11_07000 [Streptosporangiales bacterium]|nr:hypothetical protein [Streptosporangiales bacterium]